MAVNFTATNQHITTTNIPLNGLSACSFMCTVSVVSTSNAFIFSQANSTTNVDFGFNISNGKKVNAKLNINGTVVNIGTSGGVSNASTTICAIYNGSQFQLWVDGVLSATSNRTGNIVSNAAYIFAMGGYNGGGTNWAYLGELTDVRVYNRAFSDKEIAAYNESRGKDGIYNGLLAWYQLNEAVIGSTIATTINGSVRDHSPFRRNGKTTTASPIWSSDPRQYTKTRLTGTN